jgi:glycosyltransferase involved in cell wall biosynthesis
MRGGHLSLLRQVRERLDETDALLASGMLSLAELAGALPRLAPVPKIVYFHESQLSYPVPKGEAPDVHFGFTNLSTALAADRLVFNSRFHLEEFLGGIERFLAPMPDHRPRGLEAELRPKCSVVHPGIDCEELDRHRPDADRAARPVTVLWNHRWEFDKQPELFFDALHALAAEGLDFRAHIVGENFQVKPKPFLEARERLGGRIATFGHLPRREDYVRVLWDSDIAASTAIQEFFGIAVMEAAYCGARPLLPRRLVYPELYAPEYLYGGDADFAAALRRLILAGAPKPGEAERARLRAAYDVRGCVASLDDLVADAVTERRRSPGLPPCG